MLLATAEATPAAADTSEVVVAAAILAEVAVAAISVAEDSAAGITAVAVDRLAPDVVSAGVKVSQAVAVFRRHVVDIRAGAIPAEASRGVRAFRAARVSPDARVLGAGRVLRRDATVTEAAVLS